MADPQTPNPQTATPKKRHGRLYRLTRFIVLSGLVLFLAVAVARPFLPQAIRYYVNRVLDQAVAYKGKIGDIDLHLYRGAYTIHDVRILKATGNVPVPLLHADKIELRVQWKSLLYGHIVGEVLIDQPEVNFVDGSEDGGDGETGAGGPWLKIIRDLFPFKINGVIVRDGSVHFRTYKTKSPVDVYLSNLRATVSNLTNVRSELTPNVATVEASGLAMDQAKFQFQMKLNPFSYNPTFTVGLRVLGLDLTKINDLTMAYGGFDVKQGFFDLVLEVTAREGQLEGTVKPLFRRMVVFDLVQDVKDDRDVLQFFWQGVIGSAAFVLSNHNREQFGTLIPFTGTLSGPNIDLLAAIGNVLKNAFIRAYLPRLEDTLKSTNDSGIDFGPATVDDAVPEGK